MRRKGPTDMNLIWMLDSISVRNPPTESTRQRAAAVVRAWAERMYPETAEEEALQVLDCLGLS